MSETIFRSIQDETRISLAEQVAERINQLIVERNLTADEKLPNEFELAQYLNVGRGTIREAEKLLVSRNVLEIRRGKGTYVAARTGQIADPLGLAYMPDQMQMIKDLFEIRLQLEPWIASLAAERAEEEDLDRLVTQCNIVENLILQGVDHLEADKEFHTCIANCTHNKIMPKLVPIITYSVSLFGTLSKRSLQDETIVTHRKICDAVCNHQAEQARSAMIEHVMTNRTRILKMAEENL